MSNTSVGLITDDIGSSLSRLVAQATGHVTLIAPFITQGALERLVAEVDPFSPVGGLTRLWREYPTSASWIGYGLELAPAFFYTRVCTRRSS